MLAHKSTIDGDGDGCIDDSVMGAVTTHVDVDSAGDDRVTKLAAEAMRCRLKPKLSDTKLLLMAGGTTVPRWYSIVGTVPCYSTPALQFCGYCLWVRAASEGREKGVVATLSPTKARRLCTAQGLVTDLERELVARVRRCWGGRPQGFAHHRQERRDFLLSSCLPSIDTIPLLI
jgi:hypothetical protein